MSQIFTGEGLGINGSSIESLGGYGPGGSAELGQANELVYINAANGNMVLRQNDGFLADHDLAQSLLYSYNSQHGNSPAWQFNVATKLQNFSASPNTEGATLERIDEAGHITHYTYRTHAGAYLAEDGSTARISYNNNQWCYQKGDGRQRYLYDNQGQLQQKRNSDGLVQDYQYQQGRLVSISNNRHQQILFDYDSAGHLHQVTSISNNKTIHHVSYDYDTLGRLIQVTQDIATDNTGTKQYVINYGYDGDSNRINDIKQSDDTHLHVTYDELGRVKTSTDGEGRSLSYDYFTDKTIITNANGEAWTYHYDEHKHLTRLVGPKGLDISYRYQNNRLSQVIQGTHVKRFAYNEKGDCISIIDEKGHITERVFDDNHHLLSETSYLDYDLQGAAHNPITQYNVYDSLGHLRFHLNVDGTVTEYLYDSDGNLIKKRRYLSQGFDTTANNKNNPPSLTSLTDWVAAQQGQRIEEVEYHYDELGQLTQEIHYRHVNNSDGSVTTQAMITNYLYDAAGRLIKKSTPFINEQGVEKESETVYVYDDLGRLIRVTDNQHHQKLINYDDEHHRIVTTTESGLEIIQIYDTSGLILSEHKLDKQQDYGTVVYRYDKVGRLSQTQDQAGHVTTYFYDEQGRTQAQVSASGQVTEYRYDIYGNVTTTVHYTNLATPLAFNITIPRYADFKPQPDKTNDRYVTNLYSDTGLLKYQVDGLGYVTEYSYDAQDNVISKQRYATPLSSDTNSLSIDSIDIQPSSHDRINRFYYDELGQLKAKVDGEGFVTEYRYDKRGLVTATIQHYLKANPGDSWQQIIPKHNAKDISNINLYDEAGLKIATIDGDNYLTEYQYDSRGNMTASIAYANNVTVKFDENSQIAMIRPSTSNNDHQTSYQYNDLNQLIKQQDYNGLVTQFDYNLAGLLIKKTCTDTINHIQRINQTRYNSLGQVIASLDAIGAAKLAVGNHTDEESEAIWQAHAIHYQYDFLGNVTRKTDQLGNHTSYFYDNEARLIYQVNGEGGLIAYHYNHFDQVSFETHFSNKLNPNLQYNVALIEQAVSQIQDSQHDEVIACRYDRLGQLTERSKQLQINDYNYNAFGELDYTEYQGANGNTIRTEYQYDHRGLLEHQIDDALGIRRDTRKDYDAFERLRNDYDANGNLLNSYAYDSRGNMYATKNSINGIKKYKYDAYSRIVRESRTLSTAAKTEYYYDDKTNAITIKYTDSGSVTTTYNALGDKLSILDGNNNLTEFHYNENGQLSKTVSADKNEKIYHYDDAGNLVWTLTENQQKVTYSYDAAGRLLSKTIDPDGLAITTTTHYDGIGRKIELIDANSRRTLYEYDAQGQLRTQRIDADGENITTHFDYDNAGNLLLETVVNPNGKDRKIAYCYDNLNRTTDKIIDPDGLALKTHYEYDNHDNCIATTDANGNISRFIYDANDQCRFTITAAGVVVEKVYDTEGNETQVIHYANVLPTLDRYDISNIKQKIIVDDTKDQHTFYSYDAQGNVKLSYDSLGYAIRYVYDKSNNVLRKVWYNTPFTLEQLRHNPIPEPNKEDKAKQQSYIYDAMNRLIYDVDARGVVTHNEYDSLGRLTKKTVYATPLSLTENPNKEKQLIDSDDSSGAVTIEVINKNLVIDPAHDHSEVYYYDNADRLHAKVNASGFVEKYQYDAVGHVIASTAYATALATVDADINSVQQSNRDRLERHIYDGAGRERFRINSDGVVFERRFDANGNVISEVKHANRYSGSQYDLTTLEQAYAIKSNQDRTTDFVFDLASRLTDKVTEIGLEHFDYDANGNVTSKRDKANHVWTYSYDEQNRMHTQTSPQVAVKYFKNGGWVNETRGVVTQFDYDSFGNRIRLIKDVGGLEQTTEYQYDKQNRVIRELTKNVAVDVSSSLQVSGQRTENRDLSVEYVYDAFGNQVAQKDKNNNWHHYIYDATGNKLFDIDAKNYTTGYLYDAFGNVIQKIQYYNSVQLASGKGHCYTLEDISVNAKYLHNRIVDYVFNKQNQLIMQQEPKARYYDPIIKDYNEARKTSKFEYDAFGQMTATHVMRAHNDWITTRSYYDNAGNKTAVIDGEGYLTEYDYSVFGEMIASRELYNRAAVINAFNYQAGTATSLDRTVKFDYDSQGRMTDKRIKQVGYQQVSQNRVSQMQGDIVTHYTYDSLDNVTSVTDAKGNTNYNYYDAMNNLIAKVGPGVNGVHRVTTNEVDGLGNIVSETEWANGATLIDALNEGVIPDYRLVGGSSKDRTTQTIYDSSGNVSMVIDANHSAVHYSYDANGNVTRTWRELSRADGSKYIADERYEYDERGNQTSRIQFDNGITYNEKAIYNAFGEVIEKNQTDSFKVFYEYDPQGHVWRSNSNGYYQIYVYDLCDNLTQVVTSTNTYSTKENENGIDLTAPEFDYSRAFRFDSPRYKRMLQRTSNTFDKLGHQIIQVREKVETVADTNQDALQQAIQSQELDRWGNVLTLTDAKSNITRFTYNNFNQVTTKTLCNVDVMDEHGRVSNSTLVTTYSYDELGNFLAMTDANGHTVSKVYDAYGQVRQELDAQGFSRFIEYDAFGNVIKTSQGYNASDNQNQTRFEYDANNKLVSQTNAMNKRRVFNNDELGHRLTERNETAYGDLVEQLSYGYDNRGNQIFKTDARGHTNYYQYDEGNHLIGSYFDNNQDVQTWMYNQQGLVSQHTTIGGEVINYTYNTNGLVRTETSNLGRDKEYHYNADGTLRQLADEALSNNLDYTYDVLGNVITKKSSKGDNAHVDWILEQDSYEYDALGRIVNVTRFQPTEEGQGNQLFTIHYDYDAVSNIRYIHTDVNYYQNGSQVRDYYFSYDANNRMLINKGALVDGNIAITSYQGSSMHYNGDGSIADATKYEDGHSQTFLYSYDEMGRSHDIYKYLDGQAQNKMRIQALDYDDAGHVLNEYVYNQYGNLDSVTESTYQQGLLAQQKSWWGGDKSHGNTKALVSLTHDEVGNTTLMEITGYNQQGQYQFSTSHWYSYKKYDSYVETDDTATTTYSSESRLPNSSGHSHKEYDVYGNLAEVVDEKGDNSATFLNDVVEGIRAKNSSTQRKSYLNVGGHNIADITLDKVHNTQMLEVYAGFTPEGSAAKAQQDTSSMGGQISSVAWQAQRNLTNTRGTDFVKMDKSYFDAWNQDADGTPSNLASSQASTYVVQSGDSLKSIALKVYGDSSLWYLIADANGLNNAEATAGNGKTSPDKANRDQVGGLESGNTIQIPPATDGQHFTNATHKVYNAAKMIGDTSATTPTPPPPPPPPQKKVAWWKKAIIGAVAVAATLMTAGALGVAAGIGSVGSLGGMLGLGSAVLAGTAASTAVTIGIGFVAGAVGSLASQGMAVALHVQDKISMKSALIGGIATAATAGVMKGLQGTSFLKGMNSMGGNYFNTESAARSFIDNSANQLGNMAFNGGHFSWDELGGATLAGGLLASKTATDVTKGISDMGPVGNLLANEINGIAGNAIASGVTGGHFNFVDAAANSIGSSAVNAYQTYEKTYKNQNTTDYENYDFTPNQAMAENFNYDIEQSVNNDIYLGMQQASQNQIQESQIPSIPSFPATTSIVDDIYDSVTTTATNFWNDYGSTALDIYSGLNTGLDILSSLGGKGGPSSSFMDYVAEFNKSMSNAVNKTMDMALHPIDTAWGMGQMVFDGYMAIADTAFGYSTDGARERNAARGAAINNSVDKFIEGSGAERFGMLTEFGATTFLTGGVASAELTVAKMLGKQSLKLSQNLPFSITQEAGTLGSNFGNIKVVPNKSASISSRRSYLNEKFGRTGDLNLDINIRGRKEVATNFYLSQGFSKYDIPSHLTGIDFSKPLDIITINKGKKLYQFQTSGAPQGNYYSLSSEVTPSQLGISPSGFNRSLKLVEPKIQNTYIANQKVSFLKSTAASVNDFWSVPGQEYSAIGGGTQLFSTSKNFLKPYF